MASRESLAIPAAEPAHVQARAAHGTHPRAQDRQLRAAVLAVALSASRLKAKELRARYARVARKLTATEEDAAAVASRLAELLPHHANRLRALGAEAERATRAWRQAAAAGEGHGGAATAAADAAGPVRVDAASVAATRRRSEALARRLEQAKADVRATIALVQQGRPRHEILSRSALARLRAKLDTMPVIEQAKGIVMARSQCGPDEAFDLLRRISQRLNVPVRDLAAQIVANAARAPGKPGQGGGKGSPASAAPRGAPAYRPRTAGMGAHGRPDRMAAGTPD